MFILSGIYTFFYFHCSLLYFENLYLLHFCRRSCYSLVFYLTVFLLLHILGGEYIDALSFSWFQALGWYLCFFSFDFPLSDTFSGFLFGLPGLVFTSRTPKNL